MASQHDLNSVATDVTAVKACFGRVPGPTVLVGHSYGGTLITHAGTDPRVAALVYIAALAPDDDETSQSQQRQVSQMMLLSGRVLFDDSLSSCASISSYFSTVVNSPFGTMCTTL